MSKYLLCDVGSTFTKLCLVDAGRCAVLGTAACATTIQDDVNIGMDNAIRRLALDVGEVRATLVCSSAAGGLRIVAVGLVPQLTLEAARLAALGAGGKVVGAFGYRLTQDSLADLQALRPDLVLLAGGTDGGDVDHILHNGRMLQDHLPGVPIIVAGNRAAADALRRIFAGRPDVSFTDNVLPELNRLNLEPARRRIREVFLERIVVAKGLDRLRGRAKVLMPTPEAVFCAAQLLSSGGHGRSGIGELLIVDIGGATTDVYSCASGAPRSPQAIWRGLPESFAKRTVEADVGMRHTLRFLAESLDLEAVARQAGSTVSQVESFVAAAAAQPSLLPRDLREVRIDEVFAWWACRLAVTRHAGRVSEAYSPQGRLFVQEGKDLSEVPCVIGTGGPIVHGGAGPEILQGCCRQDDPVHLRPARPQFLLDRNYLLWAMGLLAQEQPAAALALMRAHLIAVGGDASAGASASKGVGRGAL